MHYTKWVCWQRDCDLPFEVRWGYSVCCDLYFRQKKMPSLRGVMKAAGVRYAVAKRILDRLSEVGLLKGMVPQYRPNTFMEKSKFKPARWWVGLHYRKVEKTGLGKRHDVLYAFLLRASAKERQIGPAYLAKATGIPKRTVNHALKALLRANKLKRVGPRLIAMVESEGQTVTLGQYYTNEVKTMLAGCPDEEVRQQLAIFGVRNFPLLFKNYQKFSDANKGHVSHRHLLNYRNKVYPDILQGGATAKWE